MKRGKRYQEAAKLRDKTNLYDAPEAVAIVKKAASAKFDETIEAHFKMGLDGRHADQQIRGAEFYLMVQVKKYVFSYSLRVTKLKKL